MSVAWLQDLEERVQQAAEKIEAQRAELETLRGQHSTLEEQLAVAKEAGAEAAAWSEERDEIKGRVEKLADHLDRLLQEE